MSERLWLEEANLQGDDDKFVRHWLPGKFLPPIAHSANPHEDPQPEAIHQETRISRIDKSASISEIVSQLVEHGCADLTSRLDLQASSRNPVSSGGFGDVYFGRLRDGRQVAIKMIRQANSDGLSVRKYNKRIARELYTWSKCSHPNVLGLLGLATFQGHLAMVSPWVANGSLPAYLKKNPSVNRCALATSICEGLAYLHTNGIVHGDIKGANVLVSGNGTPMLTDFGNAVRADSVTSSNMAAPASFSLRWAAPEILEHARGQSYASDVYALGMTILEVVTGQVPFSQLKDLYIPGIVVDKKQTPPRPEDQIPTRSVYGNILWTLLMSCWAREPALRPSAAQVRDIIQFLTPMTLAPIESVPDTGHEYGELANPDESSD